GLTGPDGSPGSIGLKGQKGEPGLPGGRGLPVSDRSLYAIYLKTILHITFLWLKPAYLKLRHHHCYRHICIPLLFLLQGIKENCLFFELGASPNNISFLMQGPPGTAGLPGEVGRVGPPGDPGKRGPSGVPGPPGPRGTVGLRDGDPLCPNACPPGRPGHAGLMGMKGHKGAKGESGEPGKQGHKGEEGEQGEPGDIGTQGPSVKCPSYALTITFAFQGPQGTRGITGITGPNGDK
ncbi:Collagen alpha-1(IX) chain, partial [Varanus komodoensis]